MLPSGGRVMKIGAVHLSASISDRRALFLLHILLILLHCHSALCAERRAAGISTSTDSSVNGVLREKRISLQYLPVRVDSGFQQRGPALFDPAPFNNNNLNNAGQPGLSLLPPVRSPGLGQIADGNPLLAALLLGQHLGIPPKAPGFNHPQHLPTNPYLALLLSHYGRYVPIFGLGRGIYGYTAANNYHNNLPFGAYKIYVDRDV